MKKKLIIIDGLSLLFRSFYALKDMTNSRNENIAGIYGFVRYLLNILEEYRSDYAVIALDTGKKTWRHDHDETYKSNRAKTPPELSHQFKWIRDVCDALGIVYYEGENCEADDWIASCVSSYKDQADIYIFSSDKDLLQLLEDNVYLYNISSKSLLQASDVYLKMGVEAKQVCDFLSLTGDASDGIEGAKGIGPKTASKWLGEYKTLDKIIENMDSLQPISRREVLRKNLSSVENSKKLVTLKYCLDVGDISRIRLKYRCNKDMKSLFEDIGLTPLISKGERLLERFQTK